MCLIGKQIGLTAFVGVTWAKSLQPFLPSQIGPFSATIFGLTFRDVLSINRYYKDAFLLKVKKQRVLALLIVKAVLYTKSIPPKVAFINKKCKYDNITIIKQKKQPYQMKAGYMCFALGKVKRRGWRGEKWVARTMTSISESVIWSYHLHKKCITRYFDLTRSVYLNLETENSRHVIANQIQRHDKKTPWLVAGQVNRMTGLF